jgi:hypothetical protein
VNVDVAPRSARLPPALSAGSRRQNQTLVIRKLVQMPGERKQATRDLAETAPGGTVAIDAVGSISDDLIFSAIKIYREVPDQCQAGLSTRLPYSAAR